MGGGVGGKFWRLKGADQVHTYLALCKVCVCVCVGGELQNAAR